MSKADRPTTAADILSLIVVDHQSRMLLESSIEKKQHNGITYFMVNEELALEAMKEIAELAFNEGWVGRDLNGAHYQPDKEQFINNLFGEEEK